MTEQGTRKESDSENESGLQEQEIELDNGVDGCIINETRQQSKNR